MVKISRYRVYVKEGLIVWVVGGLIEGDIMLPELQSFDGIDNGGGFSRAVELEGTRRCTIQNCHKAGTRRRYERV
jgi:hypothetical protein